jgi:hypothetical protein
MSISLSGSLLITGSITTTGGITISGSILSASYSATSSFSNDFTVLGNLTVFGTQSVQYITSSQLNVSDNVITVNVASPGVRFGGLSVFDSGSLSSESTASLFWDSQQNHWIYQRESGSTYDGGMLISGPRNAAGLGNELGTTACMLLVGQGGDHLTSSMIYHSSTATCVPNCLVIGGVLSGSSATFSSIVGVGGATENGWSLKSNGNLKVENNNGTTVLQVNDTSTGGKTWSLISSGAGNTHSVPAGTFYLRNSTDGITTLAVSSCGNVGIGTCNSTATLELARGVSGGIGPILFLRNNVSTAANNAVQISFAANSGGDASSPTAKIVVTENCTALSTMGFHTYDGSAVCERLRITSGGNVGIGTCSPLTFANTLTLHMNGGSNGSFFTMAGNGTRHLTILAQSGEGKIETNTAIPLIFATNETERMRINSTGVTNFSCKMCILVPTGANEEDAIIIDKALGFGQSFIRSYYANVPNYGMALRGGDGITAMYIQCQGYVGVGVSTPGYKFHTVSPDNNTTSFAAFSALNLSQQVEMWYGGIRMGGSNAHVDMNLQSKGASGVMNFITNGATRMQIDGSGNIGAPSGTNIYNASDIRLKQNITNITDGLTKISCLNPVKFNWIEGFVPQEEGKNMLGFIAQEVKNVIPEAVEDFGNNALSIGDIVVENPLRVNEKFIIPVLVKAIQELNEKVIALENK